MFPWLTNPTSLLQMYQQTPPGQGGFFSAQSLRDPQTYWANVNAQRKPGQSNWDTFMRGMLPQNMWPAQWKDDRSDQAGNRNQPDPGNVMGPPQGAPGGPDNNPQSGYDYNTVSPGYDPSWMKMFGGGAGAKRNANQAMNMGAFGLQMLQPRPPTHTGSYPWI